MAAPFGGHTVNLSPDDAMTAIDQALYTRYDREDQPDYLRVTDEFYFKQGATTGIAHIWDEDSNVGAFRLTGEQEEILNDDTILGNQTTVLSQKFTKQVPISDEAFKASMAGKREAIGQQIGDRARLTQDREGIQRTWGDVFEGNFHNTPDGVSTVNNAHTTLKGFTVDNLETGALSTDNLFTQILSLANQTAQDGEPGSHLFQATLVPMDLFKSMKEILDSDLIANSAENNENIFQTVYGQARIKSSIYIGATHGVAASNRATSYHILSGNHEMQRRVFHGLETFLIRPENTDNHSYIHRSLYHEATFPGTWEGIVSTNGTV